MKRLPRRLQVAIVLGSGLLLISLVLQQQWTLRPSIINHPYFGYDLVREEPWSANQTCVLPRIHPFDSSIWSYIVEPRSIHCGSRHLDLTYIDDEGQLKFNQTAVSATGYELSSLKCIWQPVLRKGDDKILYGPITVLPPQGAKLNHEIIRISCKNFASVNIYSSLQSHIIPAQIPKPTDSEFSKRAVNVFTVGLDSMSRLSFIRLLPATYKYLTEVMGVFVFRGMNKVADNTFPNLVAMLTGEEAYGGQLPDSSYGFDQWPIIWKNFSDIGYSTLWAEDFPEFGLFNYLSNGFCDPPTHHYLRPFWLAVQESMLLRMSSHMCFGSQPKHLLQLDYVRRFVTKYHSLKVPFFGFSFMAELSHEYLSQVAAADQDFYNFFKFLHEGGFLDRTLFIVMSDHGHRFDPMRETRVGRIEERMPFFAMHIPQSLLSEDSALQNRLKDNTARLITHYDTYSTLVDVLKHVNTGSALGESIQSLGKTLFGNIPLNRSCKDAKIPTHYCTCEAETVLPPNDPLGLISGRVIIQHINNMLTDGAVSEQCAELQLGSIKSVHEVADENELNSLPKRRIRAVISADPSNAVFEATLELGESDANVIGDISRINKYGNQSSCIKHDILRKYCFCKLRTS